MPVPECWLRVDTERKLTRFSNKAGRTNTTKNATYAYGPYQKLYRPDISRTICCNYSR